MLLAMAMAGTEDDWLRRDKWRAFYDGTYAPHLSGDSRATIEQLPWRSAGPSTPLVEFIAAGNLPKSATAIELGCGTGENLVALARACESSTGVDIVPAAVSATNAALAAAGQEATTLVADVLELPASLRGAFDFVFDCQTWQCVRKVDEAAATEAVVSLLKPGGRLLLLTGNADEPAERGPERLCREDLEVAFGSRGLECEGIDAFRFDPTEAYRRQKEFDQPPLGWRSVWRRPM